MAEETEGAACLASAGTAGVAGRRQALVQLLVGILALVASANLQYGWTFFVTPLRQRFGWSEAAIQVAFTLFVLAETWLVPFEGYLADRFGPGPLVALGGGLGALGWGLNALATSLPVLYVGNLLAGAGAGTVYGAAIGNALKWFPQRRGLAAGLTAAAFGAGSAVTVWPLVWVLEQAGYAMAFLVFGLGQGLVVLLCAAGLRAPPLHPASSRTWTGRQERDYTIGEVLRTPLFWLLYLMMTLVTLGGLMTIAQLAPLAQHYGLADAPIPLFGQVFPALVVAATLDRLLNGLTRPFFGWISDYFGRENTICLAFTLEGFALLWLWQSLHEPYAFVLLTGLTLFAWGEIFSLFPALCGDLFGRRYATANYGLLYTSKGAAALLVPLGNVLVAQYGSWQPVFWLAALANGVTAVLALAVLKPLARRWQTVPCPPAGALLPQEQRILPVLQDKKSGLEDPGAYK